MKKIYYLILAVLITATSFYLFSNYRQTIKSISPFGDADAIGSAEDANARMQYEWMLLHDPATGMIPAHIREKELAFASALPSDQNASNLRLASTVNWQQRGPWNVGGRTRAFAIDASNENILIAGSCSGGMYRSIDGGQTWLTTTPANQYQSVSCLAQDTRAGHTNTWYYGTGEAYGASASATGAYYLGNGIFKSVDGGISWSVLASTTNANLTIFDVWGDVIWNIATNPAVTVQDVVYAAAYGGIYKSLNGGTSWTLVKGTLGGVDSYFTDIAISSTGIIYASLSSDGSQKGIYRSPDGITFTNILPVNFPATYNRIKIGISPSDENQVYFLGNTPGFGQPDTNFLGDVEWNSIWKYTYLSGNGSGSGGLWEDRSSNLPTTGGLFDKFNCQGSYDLVVKVKPTDPNIVFIGGTNLYRSTSGFADDTHTTFIGGYLEGAAFPVVEEYLNHHPDQHEISFLPSNPDIMFSMNDGGIYKTIDNTASPIVWTSLNNGYITAMFYSCAIDHAATNDIVIGGTQDNGSWFTNSSNLTDSWVSIRNADGCFCAIADNSAAYYISIQNAKMMRAKLDAAGTIDSFARIDPIGGTGYLFVNPYSLDPNNNNLMYLAGGKYLWRNNDLSGIPYASNWDSITTNWIQFPDSVPTANAKISAVAISKTPANRVYYGTTAKRVFRIDNANTGTPSPVEITSVTSTALFPASGNVNCIAIDPTNADHLIVVFSNYGVYSLFNSDDGGTSWTKIGGNLEANSTGTGNGPSCRWASIMPVNGGTVYLVGTSVGLYATTFLNGLSTVWMQQGTNLIGSSVVDMMDFRSTDGLVVVATHSHGIFSAHITDVSDVTGINEATAAQSDFNFTNYPNPFKDKTIIKFTLKEKTSISLKLFDESGKLIKVIADEQMNSGEKSYSLASGNLSSGIYYCTLKVGAFSETKRLILEK